MDGIATYTSLDEMIATEDFEMVEICLPTFLHKEYSIKMLNAGKHVICEKPMALCEADCEEMIAAARANEKNIIIGQCLRFEPQYLYLKKIIEEESFGKLKYISFTRLSSLPLWGFERWFRDTARSGGCALDLHIHDVDMIRFLFGEPNAVSATAVDDVTRWQYISSRFFYDGLTVEATGSGMEPRSLPFAAGYRACFEKATVILQGNEITVYPVDAEPYKAEYGTENRMAEEIRLLASIINDPTFENTTNTPESAAKTVALVKTLCKSADNGGSIIKL